MTEFDIWSRGYEEGYEAAEVGSEPSAYDWRIVFFYTLNGFIIGTAMGGFWLIVIVFGIVWASLIVSMALHPDRLRRTTPMEDR
jgi:hypothetical protein